MAASLTPKQKRFVEEYLVDLNATRAAIRAGYRGKRMNHVGYRLLRKTPAIVAAIAEAQAERAERTRVTADKVVTELAKVAFGDPRRLFAWGPGGIVLRDSAELSDAEAALVSEVSESRTAAGGTRRVKLHCKMAALTALGKHLGLFNGRLKPPEQGDHAEANERDDPRERIARKIARIAARLRADETSGGSDES